MNSKVVNSEIVNMETYIEDSIEHANIPSLTSFRVGITAENDIRVGLNYDNHKDGKRIQTQIKDFFKEVYNIDKVKLERLYNDNAPVMLYDIVFEVPEDKLNIIYILSKISKTI